MTQSGQYVTHTERMAINDARNPSIAVSKKGWKVSDLVRPCNYQGELRCIYWFKAFDLTSPIIASAARCRDFKEGGLPAGQRAALFYSQERGPLHVIPFSG